MPNRIQRKQGEKLPPNTVYVGRGSRWANPYRVGTLLSTRELTRVMVTSVPSRKFTVTTPEIALQLYRHFAVPDRNTIRAALRGKDLADWLPLDVPSHADILLAIANEPDPPRPDDEMDLIVLE